MQKVKATWKSGVHMVSECPGGQVAMDGSKEVGGQEKGVRPKAMMLSALAGCAGVDIAMLFKKMRIEVAGFDIEVTGTLTENHPKYYDKVTVVFNFYGVDFPKAKIEKAVALSTETYCGVMAMFRKFAAVDVRIAYRSKMRKLKNIELARLGINAFKNAPKTPLMIVLDDVRSLHNIGAIFRTADAFLVEKIYLCGITATPPHMEIYKTALGATESVAWVYKKDALHTVQKLKSDGVFTVAIEQAEGAVSLEKFSLDPSKKYAVVFGNEVKGVQQEVVSSCDTCVEIPQFGTKHSLNISVSAGVVIWDFWNGLNLKK